MGWACDRDGEKENCDWKITSWKTKRYMMG